MHGLNNMSNKYTVGKKWVIRQEFNIQCIIHVLTNVSMQRSETILIMKETRIRVEGGLSSHMSQELQVGIVQRNKVLGVQVVSGTLSLRMFNGERIT